jgi:mRNA interferase RelE/StbE
VNETVIWTEPARDDLRRMDRGMARRVEAAVNRLVETGHGDVKRLQEMDREWRLRVGEWRVRFTRNDQGDALIVLRVLPRSGAYKD